MYLKISSFKDQTPTSNNHDYKSNSARSYDNRVKMLQSLINIIINQPQEYSHPILVYQNTSQFQEITKKFDLCLKKLQKTKKTQQIDSLPIKIFVEILQKALNKQSHESIQKEFKKNYSSFFFNKTIQNQIISSMRIIKDNVILCDNLKNISLEDSNKNILNSIQIMSKKVKYYEKLILEIGQFPIKMSNDKKIFLSLPLNQQFWDKGLRQNIYNLYGVKKILGRLSEKLSPYNHKKSGEIQEQKDISAILNNNLIQPLQNLIEQNQKLKNKWKWMSQLILNDNENPYQSKLKINVNHSNEKMINQKLLKIISENKDYKKWLIDFNIKIKQTIRIKNQNIKEFPLKSLELKNQIQNNIKKLKNKIGNEQNKFNQNLNLIKQILQTLGILKNKQFNSHQQIMINKTQIMNKIDQIKVKIEYADQMLKQSQQKKFPQKQKSPQKPALLNLFAGQKNQKKQKNLQQLQSQYNKLLEQNKKIKKIIDKMAQKIKQKLLCYSQNDKIIKQILMGLNCQQMLVNLLAKLENKQDSIQKQKKYLDQKYNEELSALKNLMEQSLLQQKQLCKKIDGQLKQSYKTIQNLKSEILNLENQIKKQEKNQKIFYQDKKKMIKSYEQDKKKQKNYNQIKIKQIYEQNKQKLKKYQQIILQNQNKIQNLILQLSNSKKQNQNFNITNTEQKIHLQRQYYTKIINLQKQQYIIKIKQQKQYYQYLLKQKQQKIQQKQKQILQLIKNHEQQLHNQFQERLKQSIFLQKKQQQLKQQFKKQKIQRQQNHQNQLISIRQQLNNKQKSHYEQISKLNFSTEQIKSNFQLLNIQIEYLKSKLNQKQIQIQDCKIKIQRLKYLEYNQKKSQFYNNDLSLSSMLQKINVNKKQQQQFQMSLQSQNQKTFCSQCQHLKQKLLNNTQKSIIKAQKIKFLSQLINKNAQLQRQKMKLNLDNIQLRNQNLKFKEMEGKVKQK